MRIGKVLLFALWAVAFAAGAYGLTLRALTGHELANYGSYVPWGLWVAQYTYFVGLSAGVFLLAVLAYVFGVKQLEPLGKLSLLTAFVTMACALFVIWLDLGQPMRFWRLFLSPSPTSVMAWMSWVYSAYMLILVAALYVAVRMPASRRLLRGIVAAGLVLAIAFPGGSGALFGVVGARPYWNSSLYPILFLVSALASGTALMAFVAAAFWPGRRDESYRSAVTLLGRTTLALLLLDVLVEFAEFSINLYASIPAHADAYRAVLFGPFWWVFWGGHVVLGVVLPLALLVAAPRSPVAVGAAGVLAASLFIAVRVNIVVPGQVIPELAGIERAFTDHRLTFAYAPSMVELLVSVFVTALGVALFYAAQRVLPALSRAEAATS